MCAGTEHGRPTLKAPDTAAQVPKSTDHWEILFQKRKIERDQERGLEELCGGHGARASIRRRLDTHTAVCTERSISLREEGDSDAREDADGP